MPVIATEDLRPGQLHGELQHQVYCGLDCCLTLEVHQQLQALGPEPPIYSFERALQAPYMEIMQRGFLVDQLSRHQAAQALRERRTALETTLNLFAQAIWHKPLNPRSPAQLKDFFYRALALPEVYISQKGIRKVSTNREALEKLDEKYLHSRPIVACILAIRDIGKQLAVFEEEIDSDRRHRTSYNIAGTETGRPSSSSNAFGTGGNQQNIAPALRYVFIADPGKKLCVIDLEQVEARDVGYFCGVLFGDWSFLDACESGDLHTNNAKLVWRELPWTGDPKKDRELANQRFYREFSYRDMAKRGGHLSNYAGSAWMMSRALKIEQRIAEEFQARYVSGQNPAYPCISKYWTWVAQEIQTNRQLVTPFGRRRHFFGRPEDASTIREGIAFLPQSTTGDRMNLGLWRVWKHMPQVQLLAQTFDSITFQYDDKGAAHEERVVAEALERIRVELKAPNGRSYIVPGEAKVGWNWASQVTQGDIDRAAAEGRSLPRLNPEGLIKWKPGFKDPRTRQFGFDRTII